MGYSTTERHRSNFKLECITTIKKLSSKLIICSLYIYIHAWIPIIPINIGPFQFKLNRKRSFELVSYTSIIINGTQTISKTEGIAETTNSCG